MAGNARGPGVVSGMQHATDSRAGDFEMTVRLVKPGEGAAAIDLAESARQDGGWSSVRPLQPTLDQVGGRIVIPDLDGAVGWCFAAFRGDAMVGMLYACTPVQFLQQCSPATRAVLTPRLAEIEIVAASPDARGQGVGSALLQRAEQSLRAEGVQLFTAKIQAADKPVLRWWRHRGWTLAPSGEPCFLDRSGRVGIDAGRDGRWRLAVRAPDRDLVRRGIHGLWATPPLLQGTSG